ncbi:MAG: coproporphyrinogen III oxidase [Chloroflexota bacterium]
MAPRRPDSPLGLYLHIPFCSHICPYCDFNTYAGQEALIPRYVDAVEKEIAIQGASLEGRAATTIFFGGGTPSLLPPGAVARLITACQNAFAVARDAEITLEANPSNVDVAYFARIRAAGVNRLSIGVQTLQRRGLRVLGRMHEAAEAEAAFRAARDAGFANISLDLIFGWPGQTLQAWREDLQRVLEWEPDHLSLYNLIVEPGTPMADAVARGILRPATDDEAADMYEDAIDLLAQAGWTHYEVANWARQSERECEQDRSPDTNLPGYASRHNALYWRNGEYAGFGAGAHARIGKCRTMNHLLPRAYIDAVETGNSPISNIEHLSPDIEMSETMMLGLRLLEEGVSDAEFRTRHGVGLFERFGAVIDELQQLGMIRRAADRVVLTHRGLMVANDVCARFLA